MAKPDVTANANPAHRHGRRWVMLVLIFLVYAVAIADRSTISIAAPAMMDRLHINTFNLGLIFSGFTWGYGLLAVPGGMFVDRIGAKSAIIWGMLIWSAATALAGFAGLGVAVVSLLFLSRFVVGVAEATVTPGSASVLASWFPDRERGLATAVWASANYITVAAGGPVMALIVTALGWESVFWIIGGIGVLMTVVWRFAYYHPADHPRLHPDERAYLTKGGALADHGRNRAGRGAAGPESDKPRKSLKRIYLLLKRPDMLAIFFGQYCGNSIAMFLLIWLPTYLVKAKGVSILSAGLMMVIPAVAGAVGVIGSGALMDFVYRRTGSLALSRKIPLTIGYTLCATMMLLPFGHSVVVIVLLMALALLGKGAANVGWTLIADISPRALVGTAGGLMNFVGGMGAVFSGIAIGALVQATGSYDSAVYFIGVHPLLAVAGFWLFLPRMQRVTVEV